MLLHMMAGVFLVTVSVQAAEAALRSYDIPGGVAAETLKIAAEQGRMELVYTPETVVGAWTQALNGHFQAREALEQMLQGTQLVVVPVSEGKAFGIVKRVEDDGTGLLGSKPPPTSETTLLSQSEMNFQNQAYMTKQNNWLKTLTAVLTIGIAGGPGQLSAQDDDENEILELTPFEIDESTNTGYYATETLSGTYLRTNMRTLANPVTVLTAEFLSDIGADSYEDAVSYLPSSGSFQGDIADNDGNTARTGTPYNTRGFRVTQLTQNFLATNVRQDNYNTERLTQSRGPNSLLFGLGSVGGSMNITTKRGILGSDFARAQLRFDDFDTTRYSIDYNKVLIEDKLALRLAGLNDDQRTFRDLQFRLRKSIYGNLTYKPFEKTTINFMGEWGGIDELNPRLFLTKDALTPFVNSTLSDLQKANLTDIDVIVSGTNAQRNTARNLQNNVTRGLGNTNRLTYIENDPSLGVQNYKWKSLGDFPFINGTRVNNVSIVDPQLTPDVFWPVDTIPSGPQDQFNTDYEKFGVDIQQQLFENTFLQLVAQWEETENYDFRPVRRQEWIIKVDPNYYLPTQSAADNPDPTRPLNPYYGQPYLETSPREEERWTDFTQYRANLSHKFDLSEYEPYEGFDLGAFSLVGSWYYLENDFRLTRKEEMTTKSLFANGSLDNTQGWVWRRYYLTEDNTSHWPDKPWSPISQAGDSSIPGNIKPGVESAFVNRLNPINTISETESLSLLGQWSMFKDRLILTGGWREDKLTDRVMDFVRDPVTRLWEEFETGSFGDPDVNKVQNTNKGIVLRPISWFDIFYNESTNNVNAGVTAFDIFGNGIPDQTGEGEDLGVRFFFMDDKITVKLNRYENVLQNQITNPLRDAAEVGIGLARENGRTQDFLDAMRFNGLDSQIAGALNFEDYTGNGLWTDVQNTASEGYELEVTANVTRNWQFLLNVSKQDSEVNSTFLTFKPWYEQFVAPVSGNATVRALPADPDDDPNETIGDIIDNIDRKILFHESQVGGQLLRSNEWAWNFVTTYNFDQGENWLKGVRTGAAMRWRSAPSLGFPEDADGNFDTSRTFKGTIEFNTDVFISKRWNVGKETNPYRVDASFRIRNLFDQDGWVPRTGVDDGNGTRVSLQQVFLSPRSYELTIDVSF